MQNFIPLHRQPIPSEEEVKLVVNPDTNSCDGCIYSNKDEDSRYPCLRPDNVAPCFTTSGRRGRCISYGIYILKTDDRETV